MSVDPEPPAADRSARIRVTERISITPARREDERPRPLIIRFNPGLAVRREPASADEGRRRGW